MDERKKELFLIVDNNKAHEELIDNIIFLENRLKYLRTLPTIRVNPDNPEQQKLTASGKQYKEYLQQYLNAIKMLLVAGGKQSDDDSSPLRDFLKNFKGVEIR